MSYEERESFAALRLQEYAILNNNVEALRCRSYRNYQRE